ncbi:unnamed protein product [Durusdinium trenchii]|uniref:Uncharacterized protein n=1 Tax=Durusdinium trenchii TaxID=1381693 RepID=A0ABP0PX11_9DINO
MWLGSAVGITLRYALYFARVPEMLEEHLELNSPITSHVRLKEGLFFLENGISPYAGDTCHTPPLVLLLLQLFHHVSPLVHFTALVLVDVVTALLLRKLAVFYRIARQEAGVRWAEASAPMGMAAKEAAGIEDVISPAFVGLFYLLNPLTIASCVALSLQNLQHLVFAFAIVAAAAGKGGLSAIGVALSLYVCPFTAVLLILPCAALAHQQSLSARKARDWETGAYSPSWQQRIMNCGFIGYCVFFASLTLGLFACLLGASAAAMGGELQFFEACFVSVIAVRDLTPNTGLFWYMFTEVFQRYYLLFIFAFHAHILFYSVPLHLRLGCYAPTGTFIHCGAALGMICLFKPYPTASDYGLMLSAMLVQAELIKESQQYFAFLLSGVMFGLSMVPTMVAVWLGRNAGNANYMYNMTLIVNVFGSLTLSQWVKAGLRLRKRQHSLAYFRQLVLDIVDEVVADPKAAKVKASAHLDTALQ